MDPLTLEFLRIPVLVGNDVAIAVFEHIRLGGEDIVVGHDLDRATLIDAPFKLIEPEHILLIEIQIENADNPLINRAGQHRRIVFMQQCPADKTGYGARVVLIPSTHNPVPDLLEHQRAISKDMCHCRLDFDL